MKRIVLSLILMLAACCLLTSAMASRNCETYGIVTVRTGPWDLYDEICTLPSGTVLQAIEYEVNDEDGMLWHLIEFTLNGKLYRGYVDENAPIALESASGYNEADHYEDWICHAARDVLVYAAPSSNAAITGDIMVDEDMSVLDVYGDFLLIDYEQYGRPCRGYIASDAIK